MEIKLELHRNSINLHDCGTEKSSCYKALLYGPNTRKVNNTASIPTQPQGISQWENNGKLDLVTTHGGIDLDGSQRMLIV